MRIGRQIQFLHPQVLSLVLLVMTHLCPVSSSTLDEIIAGASVSMDSFQMMQDIDSPTRRQELDMVLTLDQWKALQVIDTSSKGDDYFRKKRKAIKNPALRWKNNLIPYKISGAFSYMDREEIMGAIDEWRSYTCIQFREAQRQDSNFVSFENGNGCYSSIGMVGGSQTIGLAKGCRSKGIIIHEIGHAVGFFHEQNRPDRDDYVRIRTENVDSGLLYNFQKYPSSAVLTMGVPYDYNSVMHYGRSSFTLNGEDTIQTVNPAYQDVIGNRKGLSFYDIKLANLMYQCNNSCPSNLRCPNQGFVGKDCKCWCEGSPVKLCENSKPRIIPTKPTVKTTKSPVTKTTPTSSNCVDTNENCRYWAKEGYCRSNSYVKSYCKKSCRSCQPITAQPKNVCRDNFLDCSRWKAKGYCSTYKTVKLNCARTCNTCRSLGKSNADDVTTKASNNAHMQSLHFSLLSVLVVKTFMTTFLI